MGRTIIAGLTLALGIFGFGLMGCGSSPCADYCSFGCDRAVECNAPGASSSTVGVCAEQCTELAEENFTASLCETALTQVQAMSCEEYLTAIGF